MAPDRESDEAQEGPGERPVDAPEVPPAETAEDAVGEAPDVAAEAAVEAGPPPGEGGTPGAGEPPREETADVARLQDELAALRAELEGAKARAAEAEAQAQENLERVRRTLADWENFRKRSRTQAEEAREKAKADVLRELVTVMDNFDRALEHAGDEEALYDGLKLIYRQFRSTLEAQGLRRVDAEGHAFDPQMHEAVMREPTAAYKEGVVIKEFEKGWFLGDKLLRPAKVKVAVAPPPGAPDEGAGSAGEEEET